jgi:hypothetical protein
MDLSLTALLDELATRLSTGPLRFRLIMQPVMAAIVGARAGIVDAKSGMPPFILSLMSRRAASRACLKTAVRHLMVPVFIATALDAMVQYLMFGHIRPLSAVIFGSILMSLPYSIARELSNRIRSRRGTARQQWVKREVQPLPGSLDPDQK